MSNRQRQPRVSIVIPCYRGEPYIAKAVTSCLGQTEHDVEVVIVNDASPDHCLEIAQHFAKADSRVTVVDRASNGGVAEALNSGFAVAKARLFTRLAQDDLFMPSAVKTMADFLESRSETGLTYANMEFIDAEDRSLGVLNTEPPERALLPACRIGLCVMWRREVWERTGRFDPRCDFAEDYDYWLRVSRRFTLAKCSDEVLLRFRYHSDQNSVTGEHRQIRSGQRALMKHWWWQVRQQPWRVYLWLRFFRRSGVWLS